MPRLVETRARWYVVRSGAPASSRAGAGAIAHREQKVDKSRVGRSTISSRGKLAARLLPKKDLGVSGELLRCADFSYFFSFRAAETWRDDGQELPKKVWKTTALAVS